MMNIGFNPTVNGEKQTIEVHLFDFDTDIYGEKIEVSLLHYLREEQKFGSVDLLKAQLNQDKIDALTFIQKL
ncbi:Riboflavin biosynthesis protein RibF [compost metagenome]